MCLAQGYNTVAPVRLEPLPLSLESSTLPLSHCPPMFWLRNNKIYFIRCLYILLLIPSENGCCGNSFEGQEVLSMSTITNVFLCTNKEIVTIFSLNEKGQKQIHYFFLVWFDSLYPSQQLRSCQDGHFT